MIRRLKGSHDSTHYLDRDELAGLKRLAKTPTGAFVFMTERGTPFSRIGVARMIERAGKAAGLPFPVQVHMLRHATGYALTARGMGYTADFSTSWVTPRSQTRSGTRR
jgi:site-specific recombinase XerD